MLPDILPSAVRSRRKTLWTKMYQHGTTWDMSPSERRPRISAAIADKIDILREDIPFEAYIANVLSRHIGHHLGTDPVEKTSSGEDRRHTYVDHQDTVLFIDRETRDRDDLHNVVAGLVVDDEDYESVGVYLDEPELRALRDVCTELLGEYTDEGRMDRAHPGG